MRISASRSANAIHLCSWSDAVGRLKAVAQLLEQAQPVQRQGLFPPRGYAPPDS